ncbi:MAG: hypothetical protein WCL21_18240 [Mariniphaga sp.]
MAIDIPIITTFNNTGAKQATQSLTGLESVAKKLGEAMVGAFAVSKLYGFAKSSISAFTEEDKAAKTLGQTLKNLGLASSTNSFNDYVVKLSEATGVSRDQLRPALESLLRATGDSTTSQDLLNLSMNISAGTGKDLTLVAGALAKAYGGSTTALTRLGTGLTTAQLKSKDFHTIYEELNTLFAGQATIAANSAAGAIDRISIAATDAKETIGNGLISAIENLNTNHTGVDAVQSAFKGISQYIADSVDGISILISKMATLASASEKSNPLWNAAKKMLFTNPILDGLSNLGSSDRRKKEAAAAAAAPAWHFYDGWQGKSTAAAIAAKAAAASAKAAADQLKAQQALARAAADKLKLDKAASVFNIQGIEIAAALKGKISDQDRIRLELQQAILDKNADKAAALQAQLENSIAANKALAEQINSIKAVASPFDALIQGAKDSLAAVVAIQNALLMGSITGTDGSTSPTMSGRIPTYNTGSLSLPATDMPSQAGATAAQSATYNIAINAGTVVDHQTLVQMLQDQITQNAASGTQPLWVRQALPAGAL